MTNARLARITFSALAVATLVAACGGSDDASSEPGEASTDQVTDAPVESSDSSNETESEPTNDGEPGGTVGNGLLRIDGVEYPGFSGECEILRGSGSEDVGDLSVEGKQVIVAIDNVDPDAVDNANDLNFIMTNETSFRVRNTDRGTIESISEIGSRTSDGSRDYVTVLFAGALEDGSSVEAEVFCVIQNKF